MFFDDVVKYFSPHLWRQDEPSAHSTIKYHPQFGFEGDSRPRKRNKATKKELDSANIDLMERDYCSLGRIIMQSCIRKNFPFLNRCTGFENELKQCYFDEQVHDMKEFEREKRLNIRERRLREQAAKG